VKYKFKCPLFRVKVLLVIGDKKQLEKIVEDFGENYHDAECHTIYDNKCKIKGFLLWIEDPNDYHALVHESMHLLKRIFECINIPFTTDNDEIMAYYQCYWVRKFWNKMSLQIEKEKKLKEVKND
jgi:hypothetical protein